MVTYGEYLRPADERFWDPEEFFPRHYKIRDLNSGRPVPFRLFKHQLLMAAAVKQCLRERKWLAVVKSRKQGSSVFFSGVATQQVGYRRGCHGSILAQREDVAKELAGACIQMHRSIPERVRPHKLPGLKRTLEFPAIGSKLDISSVHQDDPLRGSTGIQFLLATEICKWGDRADETWTAALSNVSDTDGFVIAESTPLYHDDPLQKLWKSADQPGSKWNKLFIPWTKVDYYAKDPPPGWEAISEVADYAHKYSLSLEQAFWMETVGLTRTRGRVDKFRAEYPINEIDCWLVTGECMFDSDRLMEMRDAIDNGTGLGDTVDEYVEWEKPWEEGSDCKGDRYAILVDPASSYAERDMFAVVVINLSKCTQAAEYFGHTTAHILAKKLCEMGSKYNNATMYIEANGVGEALLTVVQGMGYPNLFYRRDSTSGTRKPGWWNSKQKKSEAIARLQELIEDGSYKIRSTRSLSQLLNYRGQWDKLSNQRDVQGGHYDLVAAHCMAAWAFFEEAVSWAPGQQRREEEVSMLEFMKIFNELHDEGVHGVDTPWGKHL